MVQAILHPNMIHTLALAGLVLFLGYGLRRLIPFLSRYNLPAPVVGGLVVALLALLARQTGLPMPQFDTTLRDPLMIAFFTSVGFGASVKLLKRGGPQVALFFLVAVVFAALQNLVGILAVLPFGLPPLLGVLCGSVTLTGGPATGLAFAPEFAKAGIPGAAGLAVAAAMFGILTGGLLGSPLATALVERAHRHPRHGRKQIVPHSGTEAAERSLPAEHATAPVSEDAGAFQLLKSCVVILCCMWLGAGVSHLMTSWGLTLPAYIGAMVVAALVRNLDDWTGALKLSQRMIDDIGYVALSLFLALALMTLRLWELAGLVLPLVVVLAAQVVLIAVACRTLVFRVMGGDYDAAVMSGGFVGFMLGTMANAMAVMEALVERYGKAPRAYLVVPIVGVFFIDFANAFLITVLLNVLR